MPLHKPRNWTRYIRNSFRGNLRKHPISPNDNWRKMERYYTTVSPILASTAVHEAWKHGAFESVSTELRPQIKRLLFTIVSRTLFSNMTDLPSRASYRDAKISRETADTFMPQIQSERKKIIELIGQKRAKILFKELSSLIQLLSGAQHE